MAAQIMLDVSALESQQKLILERFQENKELMEAVSSGINENIAIAKANVAIIRKSEAK